MIQASLILVLSVGTAQNAGGTKQSPGCNASLSQSLEMAPSGSSVRSNAELGNQASLSSYKLSGEISLLPARISDDGTHMYLEWADRLALPAVFAVNAHGKEEMVDGYMRQGIFTIDRIHYRLVFRIDKKKARADRIAR